MQSALKKKTTKGLNQRLILGSVLHLALEQFYPILQQVCVHFVLFKSSFSLQMKLHHSQLSSFLVFAFSFSSTAKSLMCSMNTSMYFKFFLKIIKIRVPLSYLLVNSGTAIDHFATSGAF